jgi:mono/diheme cytochrome c family protein
MKRTMFIRPAGALLLAALLLIAFTWTAAAQTPGDGAPAENEQTALGSHLYAENCVVCHGEQGQGRVGATLAKDWPSIRPDLTVRAIIANGVPGSPMPAWSQAKGGPLSEQEIDALTAYILSWQTGGAPQSTPAVSATARPPITPLAEVQGDPNRGGSLFDQNCDMCHGPNGEGRFGDTLIKDWDSIRPDLTVRTIIANGVPGSPMPAWSQAKGGPLNETEIDDLTAFVLAIGESGGSVQISPTAAVLDFEPGSPMSGWAGVALFAVLLVGVVALILWLQRSRG